jgi:hypothetical protein
VSVVAGQRSSSRRGAPAIGRWAASRAAKLDRRHLGALGVLLVLGLGFRLWIAFTNYGVVYDVDTAYIVAHLLSAHPLHAYSSLRYPYPGGFLPVLLLCKAIASGTGAAFWAVFKVPSILADLGIAAVLVWGLGRLGATPRERLVTAALVALGPSFLVVSGFHGQIDAVAILPALAGVIVWRLGGSHRAWQAGLLVGLGAAVKTVPLFMVLALLPTARSRREALTLIGCAIALPLASVAPFLIADTHHTITSLTFNKGVPGFGGLSVLVQPSLLTGWLTGHLAPPSSTTWFFVHHQNEIVAAAVVVAGAYAYRRRMDPISTAALIWLVVYVTNFNWAYQYFVWGLPFFLLAGRRLEVAAVQLLLALPTAQLYFHFAVPGLDWSYLPLIMLVWAAFAGSLVFVIARARLTRSGVPG